MTRKILLPDLIYSNEWIYLNARWIKWEMLRNNKIVMRQYSIRIFCFISYTISFSLHFMASINFFWRWLNNFFVKFDFFVLFSYTLSMFEVSMSVCMSAALQNFSAVKFLQNSPKFCRIFWQIFFCRKFLLDFKTFCRIFPLNFKTFCRIFLLRFLFLQKNSIMQLRRFLTCLSISNCMNK